MAIKIVKEDRKNSYFSKYKYSSEYQHIKGVRWCRNKKTLSEYNNAIVNLQETFSAFQGSIHGGGALNLTDFAAYYGFTSSEIHLNIIESCINISQEMKQYAGTDKCAILQIHWDDNIRIFGNNLNLVKKWCKILGIGSIREAVIGNIPLNVKYFTKEPKHKFRIYLKSKKVNDEWKSTVLELIERYKGSGSDIYTCGSLSRFLYSTSYGQIWYSSYTKATHFIDYDDESMKAIISMIIGNDIIANEYKLEKKP